MPSISVAMCTFNGERFVRDQLESIAAQARRPDELVVCDDASNDGTAHIVREFAGSAPFPVRLYVNAKNLGPTDNYQQAVGLCHEDLIAFADQDDVWLPGKLEKVEALFRRRPDLGAVFSDAYVVDESLKPLGYTLWQSIRFSFRERCLVRNGRSLDVLMKYNIASGATMVFNARQYRGLVHPIPPQCLGDHWMALICAAVGRLGMLEEPLVKYRKHPAQCIGPRGSGSLIGICFEKARRYITRDGDLGEFRSSRTMELSREKALYSSAYERLKESGALSSRPEIAKQFEEKLAHLEARERLANEAFVSRLRPLMKEVRGSRYRRYSNGLSYPIGDLLA
jgi:glycosyltransferase involved in cell wall biosynthesis